MNRKHLEEINDQKIQGKVVKIAIACFGEEIAPCFAATRRFLIWELGSDSKINSGELTTSEIGGLARIRLLKQAGIDVLICNGIGEQARQLLETDGIHVVETIVGSLSDALYGYLAGKIPDSRISKTVEPFQLQPHTTALLEWTVELFSSFGWTIELFTQSEAYPIDFKAVIQCPLCGKSVQVAVCCGAHSYNIESEIQEFGHVTAREFDARIYVHQAASYIINWCRDYEIELLDPASFTISTNKTTDKDMFPPLKERIKNHPKINNEQKEHSL